MKFLVNKSTKKLTEQTTEKKKKSQSKYSLKKMNDNVALLINSFPRMKNMDPN